MPPTKHSRYEFTLGVQGADGRTRLTPRTRFGYRKFDDNILHAVSDGDTWFNIAGLYYEDLDIRPERFFFAVCDFQPTPVIDPTVSPEAGTTVVVPSVRTMQDEVLHQRRRVLF